MARLQLNKSSLAREAKNLDIYRRFLPSLDLKRQQLMALSAAARRALASTQTEVEAVTRSVGATLPMLANDRVDLSGLVRVEHVALGEENLVGTTLPTLERVEVTVRAYALMAQPHWVDDVATALERVVRLKVRAQVEARRVDLLAQAVKTITQRVNLFEKVLIPRAEDNIRRIRIYLSEQDMAAVVRSKLAKRKHAEARA